MEHSVHSRRFLGGKSNASGGDDFQMVLRSGSRTSSQTTKSSTNMNSSSAHSPIKLQNHNLHIIQQSPRHHHIHHHHENSRYLSVHNHQHYSHEEQKFAIKHMDKDHSKHLQKSETVAQGSVKELSEKHQDYFSDYSSGIDDLDTDADVKTDYTYAGSVSYNSRVSANRECPSPNMSRSRLRRFSASFNSYHSSDESMEAEDEMFLKTKSHQSVSSSLHRTSTPALSSHGIERNLFAFHQEFGEQISFLGDHFSQSILSWAMSSLSSFTSVVSHTVYNFICTATSVDTFILSRCCGSKSRKCGVLFLFLLLPLLLLLQSLLTSDFSKHFPTNYLSGLSSKSLYESSVISAESSANKLSSIEAQNLYVHWQSELEKKINEELERRWIEQTKQMENRWLEQMKQMESWQGTVMERVKDIDIQQVKEEITQLRSELVTQLRKEDTGKSTDENYLKLTLDRLNRLEEKQGILEATLLDLENCCKKQGLLAMGVSQEELSAQLSAFAQEVRTNLSQLMLLQSSSASHSNVEDVHFMKQINSSYSVPMLGEIQKIIKVAIDRYDADKTGLVDYALESAGGSVISTRCTESYPQGTAQFSLFGVPFWYSANTPRTVIQPQVHPGECWAMRGTQGYLVIQLSATIRPTAFSLEHIPRELSPTGKIDSAPKEFSVIGLRSEKDTDGVLLGQYVYEDSGEPLQKFNVQNAGDGVFSVVELRVHSNHGNPEYTCLYRFRVHGIRQ